MKIGCVKEIKEQEYRVGMTPSSVRAFCDHGHEVMIETEAGDGIGFSDQQYSKAGAIIKQNKKEIFNNSDMIVKVKEPLPEEYDLLQENQILFTYLHLAAMEELTEVLMEKKVKSVAYETIETENGQLPCLKPMSEIAGRLSIQEGAKYLEKPFGGRGILLGGVPGVRRGKITIIGGGVAGLNACKIATGIGADVTILDIDPERLEYLDNLFGSRITTLYSTESNIKKVLEESDVVVGAVLVHGAQAPKIIRKEHLDIIKDGAVLVDISVDQGGCAETTKPTTHEDPIYMVDGVIHYCVANMPGVVALSSTKALTSTTLPYGLQIADKGLEKAVKDSDAIRLGVNTYDGKCVYPNVAQAFDLEYHSIDNII